MTQIEQIKEAARKQAAAIRVQDFGAANFQRDWARKAIRLENDPKVAEAAYKAAYSEFMAQHR